MEQCSMSFQGCTYIFGSVRNISWSYHVCLGLLHRCYNVSTSWADSTMRQKDIARLNMVTIKTSVLQALSASPQQLVMEFGHEDLSERVFTTEAYDHAAQVTLVKYHFWCIIRYTHEYCGDILFEHWSNMALILFLYPAWLWYFSQAPSEIN